MIKPKVEVKHLGPDHLARIRAAVKKADGSFVTVGFPAGKKYPGEDVTVAQVALFNEFGTYTADGRPHVPARPFMRPAIDENKAELQRSRTDAITKVAFMGVEIETALEDLGNVAKGMIVAKINSNVPPPNAPSTIERKLAKGHGEQTLIDSGLMRDSVTVTVHLSDDLKAEKEEKMRIQAEAAHDSHKRAQARQAYRKEAQARLKAKRDKTAAQRSAQNQVKAATKKAGKAIRKAGKSIKKFADKKQKAVGRNVRKGVIQTSKTIKASVKAGAKTAAKGIRNASSRIKGSSGRRTRGKPDATDKD